MESVLITEWVLNVDVEQTKVAYEAIAQPCQSETCRNFVIACNELEQVVLDFAKRLAIDLSKPSQLSCHRVEGNSAAMYSGQYHIIGEVLEGDIDAWDVIVGEHCFSLTAEFTHVPSTMPKNIIEISFEVVLPWVLD